MFLTLLLLFVLTAPSVSGDYSTLLSLESSVDVTDDIQQLQQCNANAFGEQWLAYAWLSESSMNVQLTLTHVNGTALFGGAVLQINTDTTSDCFDVAAQVSFDRRELAVAWMQESDGSEEVFARIVHWSDTADYSSQESLDDLSTAVFRVNSETDETQKAPMIAALRNGNFVFVFESHFDSGRAQILRFSIYDSDGTAVVTDTRVSDATAMYYASPSVSALPDSDVFVISYDYLDYVVFSTVLARAFDASDGSALTSEIDLVNRTSLKVVANLTAVANERLLGLTVNRFAAVISVGTTKSYLLVLNSTLGVEHLTLITETGVGKSSTVMYEMGSTLTVTSSSQMILVWRSGSTQVSSAMIRVDSTSQSASAVTTMAGAHVLYTGLLTNPIMCLGWPVSVAGSEHWRDLITLSYMAGFSAFGENTLLSAHHYAYIGPTFSPTNAPTNAPTLPPTFAPTLAAHRATDARDWRSNHASHSRTVVCSDGSTQLSSD